MTTRSASKLESTWARVKSNSKPRTWPPPTVQSTMMAFSM
jgi:hypothetical protein